MDPYIGKNGDRIDHEELKELRLYGFFLFALWPLIAIAGATLAIYTFFRRAFAKSGMQKPKAHRTWLAFVVLPYHLVRMALKQRNFKVIVGMVLLLPFMLTTIISILSLFSLPFARGAPASYEVPHPPMIYRLFGSAGEGLLGTDAKGTGIGKMIIFGAVNTYLVSLIATAFILIFGLWLGKQTLNSKADFLIMGFVEVIETIPVLFLLLIVLAIFSWWEDQLKAAVILAPARIFIMGLCIGLGFLPRMVRLVRERIKTFVNENFVDGAKAHGIDQNRILWYHIIRKNCLTDIVIVITQIWGVAILIEISLDYLVSISSGLLGAKMYRSWAQMLITAKEYIIFLKYWWTWTFPGFFILSTIIGFYLFGDGLRAFHRRSFIGQEQLIVTEFDRNLQTVARRIGLIEND